MMTGRGEFHPAGTPSPRLTLFARRFEKLVRGPKPWYFGHILLPGGSANLRIPKYNLKDGPEATTLGTVMECLAVERRTDGCLVVVSQGVGRFRVRDVKRTLPHDVVDASWVLDAEEGDHDAWRAFEFGPVWKSTSVSGALSHFSALTRPTWLGRAARNRHRHAIEQASCRWRGGRRDDSARTRRKILISTQAVTSRAPNDGSKARTLPSRCGA